MKVAIVHDFLTQLGGAEKVLEVLSEMFPEAPIYTIAYNEKKTGSVFGKKDIRTSSVQKMPFGVTKYKWYLNYMPTAIESFDLSEYDLVISNCSAFAKGVIINPNATHICYLLAPTRYLWNETHYYLKTAGIPWPVDKLVPFSLTRLRNWDYLAAKRPDYIISISQEIQKRTEKYYHRDSEVIYPFVNGANFKISEKTEDYYLIAGRMVPYKRNDIVVEAFNKLDLSLKVVGDGYGLSDLKKLAKSEKIEFLGRVPDSDLKKYLSSCKAFIFPSDEDFGIVPLEAMASGRPVVAYKKGGALETIKDGTTGVFFDEQSPESLIKCIEKFRPEKYNPYDIREHAMSFDRSVFKRRFKSFVDKHISTNN